jgi:replicative DNA helicase
VTDLPQIPCKPDLERALLGVVLLAPERVAEIADRLDPSDFFVSVHRKVYRAMLELEGSGKPIDFLTLHEILAADQEVTDAGGAGFISKLTDGCHAKAPITHYAATLKTQSMRRALQRLCESTLADTATGNLSEVLDHVSSELETIRDGGASLNRGPVRISEAMTGLSGILERAADGRGQMIGLSTGYSDVDAKTAGWQAGDFNILAARPGQGKTAFALELAARQAKAGNAVLFFSLEMSRDALILRIACREARVDSEKVRHGMLSHDEVKCLVAAIGQIARLPIFIDDSAAIRASDLRWRLRSLAKRHNIKLCVVDYLQLLRAPGRDRFETVTNTSIELKAAAKELGQVSGGTLLALSQLNRLGATERPRLEHLRESGQIEQDADAVFLLYNGEESENGQLRPSTKVLEVAKQRNGPWGQVHFTFLPAIGAFEQTTRRDDVDWKAQAAGTSEEAA